MDGGKQWWYSPIIASLSLVGGRLRTWAVGGRTRGGDGACARCRAGGMVATSPTVTWPLQFGVKGRRGGECNDPPAYADGDDGKHHHHLYDMACCHVITCMLHHLLLCLASAVVIVGSL